jgi:hypothetical protein
MEIVELIFAIIQLGGCFLELAAATSGGAAAYTGNQTYRNRKKSRETGTPPSSSLLWRFLVFLVIAVGILMLVIAKWAVWVAG